MCFVLCKMRKKVHAKQLWNGRVPFNEWNITELNVDYLYLISGWKCTRYHKRGGKRIQARSDEEKNSKQKIGSNGISFNTLKRVECLQFTQCSLARSLRRSSGRRLRVSVCFFRGFLSITYGLRFDSNNVESLRKKKKNCRTHRS